jgi:hypothetical protein
MTRGFLTHCQVNHPFTVAVVVVAIADGIGAESPFAADSWLQMTDHRIVVTAASGNTAKEKARAVILGERFYFQYYKHPLSDSSNDYHKRRSTTILRNARSSSLVGTKVQEATNDTTSIQAKNAEAKQAARFILANVGIDLAGSSSVVVEGVAIDVS